MDLQLNKKRVVWIGADHNNWDVTFSMVRILICLSFQHLKRERRVRNMKLN